MDQQWLYLLLLTQPDVSNGGVLAVRETRWGPDTADNFQVLCTSCNCSKGARV
jgi:hypothetical protein